MKFLDSYKLTEIVLIICITIAAIALKDPGVLWWMILVCFM